MPQPYRQIIGSYHDSKEGRERWDEAYAKACHEFQEGCISIHVFRAKLHGLGIKGNEMESDINLNWPMKEKKK